MAYIILFIFSFIINASNSFGDENEPVRITIYPSRIIDLGLGSNKILITKKQIQDSNAKNLPDLLSRFPGIQNLSYYGGVDNTKASIGIGGFGEQATMNTAIFLDGVRINNISIAKINFGNIPLNNIEKIEIIRGNGAGVLYGDGAVAGAINIITNKNLLDKEQFELDQSIMSFNGLKTNLNVSKNINDIGIQFNHNYTRSDQYRDNNKYKLDSSSINFSNINDGGVYRYIKLKKFEEDIRLPGGINLSTYYDNPKKTNEPESFAREELGLFETGYYNLYIGDFKTNGSISFSTKETTSYFDSSYGDSSYRYNYDTFQGYKKGEYKNNLLNQPSVLNFGIDFYSSDYSDEVLIGSYYKRTSDQVSFDPWIIGQIFFVNGYNLEAGVRHHFYELDVYDETTSKEKIHNKSTNVNAWSFGGTKTVNENNILNMKLSKSFRSPKIDEVVGWGGAISEIEHQNSKMFEVGHEIRFDNFMIKTNAFTSKVYNLIYYNGSENDNYDPTVHRGYDIETNVKYNNNVNFVINASNVISEFDTGSNKGKQLPMVANWTSNANIIYDYNNELKFSLSNLFVGSRYRLGDESNSYPKAKSYNIFNGKLKYNINDMKISFKINNILDKNYYHYDSYGSIYPLPGRNFSLNFNYSFWWIRLVNEMKKNLKVLIGFFITVMIFRYFPHLPNFTPVLALTFYGTIIFGRNCLIYIILAYALSDFFIGFHNQLFWTWGSLFLIGYISTFFKGLSGRSVGVVVSSSMFFILTNLGVYLSGYYGYTFDSLILCYTLAIPFYTNTIISTIMFSVFIEFFVFSKFFNFIPISKNKIN